MNEIRFFKFFKFIQTHKFNWTTKEINANDNDKDNDIPNNILISLNDTNNSNKITRNWVLSKILNREWGKSLKHDLCVRAVEHIAV